MKKEEYALMHRLEDKHWWFSGKRYLIFRFIDKFYRDKDNIILDVGCGTGIIMREFGKYGKVYGVDTSDEALKFCRDRGLKKVRKSSVLKLPFKNNSFDIVGCFDVLYHKGVSNDVEALKEIYRVLKIGGRVFITDSAMMCLWGRHDLATHARERYSKKELKEKLERVGFKIEKISYYNFFLFPIVLLTRKIDNIVNRKKSAKSNIEETNKFFNSLLFSLFKLETNLLNLTNFPFGVSIFCIARK